VSSYLILAALAGPSVCCCTVGQLAERVAAAIRPTKPAAENVRCCCRRWSTKRQGSPGNSNRDDPDSAPGDRPSCPCDREHARVGAVEDTFSVIRIASNSFESADAFRPDTAAGIGLAQRAVTVDDDIAANVDDLLRAMHLLRC
jgi:hypothetical protein